MRTHVYAALIATVAATTSATDLCLKGTATDYIQDCTWDICSASDTNLKNGNCLKKFPLAALPQATEDISKCIYGAVPKGSDLTTC